MDVAVVTGASSGIGKEIAIALSQKYEYDEMWVIARSREGLEALAQSVKTPLRVIPSDLSQPGGLDEYKRLLEQHRPTVKMLVNAAGYGKFGRYDEIPVRDAMGMIDLNARALAETTLLTLPYITRGGKIMQMASLSSFQPVPYLNVYAATKAFVLSFSRALNAELKNREISVMAIAPGWVRTPFFERAEQTSQTAVTHFNKVYLPSQVAQKALRDLERGKDVSILGLPVRAQVLLVKLLPHRLVMRVWMRQQKHV